MSQTQLHASLQELTRIVLEGRNVCTHETIPLAIWILLIYMPRIYATASQETSWIGLILFSYIKSVEINDATIS